MSANGVQLQLGPMFSVVTLPNSFPKTWLTLKFLSFRSHELPTMEGAHRLLTTKLILISNLFHPLHWVFPFVVVVLYLCARWQIHNDMCHLFSVTASVVEGLQVHYRLRQWLVMESCETMSHIQRNVCFFFFFNVCSYSSLEFCILKSASLLRCCNHNNLSKAITCPARIFH